MKTNLISCTVMLAGLLLTAACGEDDGLDLNLASLPSQVASDFDTRHPNASNISWEQDGNYWEGEWTEDGLEKEIVYDLDGNWVQTESEIPLEDVPQAALDYINANYPTAAIDEAESISRPEGDFVVVEIEDGDTEIEVTFDADGNFIEEEIELDDDDDDEEDENEVSLEDVPQAALDYINTNYPNAVIEEAVSSTGTEGDVVEVELEDGDTEIEIVFDADGNVIEESTEREITLNEMPQAAIDYINTNYPNAAIEEAKAVSGTEGDGIEVELEDGNTEIEILFDSDGNVIEESTEREITLNEVPQAAIDYISTNYPNAVIDEAVAITGTDGDFFEVELEDGSSEIEILFDADGNFIEEEIEEDDDDDDDDDD